MADHIRLGGPIDPMDAMFTASHNIDLTRNVKVPEESVGLGDLGADIEETAPIIEEPRKPRGEVVHAKMSDNVQAFDPTTLIPKTEKKDEGANEVYAALDIAIQREKESITARHEALKEKMYEDYLEGEAEKDMTETATINTAAPIASKFIPEDDDDDMEYTEPAKKYSTPEVEDDKNLAEESVKNITPRFKNAPVEEEKPATLSIKKTVTEEIELDEEELDELIDENEAKRAEAMQKQEEEMNDIVEGLKAAAKETIRPTMKTIDLSKFKIGGTPQKISTVIMKAEKEESIADWVMYDSECSVAMSGLTGPELLKLDPDNSNRNRLNTMKDIHKIIYDHVVDSKKVGFDQWMKQTRYSDIDNLYFGLYMATFHGSNFVSYQCPDCKKVFIKDIDFKDMIKYKTPEVEAKVRELMQKPTDNGAIEYNVDLIQVSDKYVFGMKAPSLYNVIIETAGLPDNVLEKYADLIDTITYIDSVYTIDTVNMQLNPVVIPVVKDDPVKSTIKKIKSMYSLLADLSSDEYYMLRGYISKQTEKSSEISYRIPEGKCPDCDKEIPANEDMTAASLLFTRHHLGAFANM